MSPAGHQAHVRAGARQLHAEIAADRAGAVNADFHGLFREDENENSSARYAPVLSKVSGRRVGGGLKTQRQAWIACFTSVASSSNAVEMSRMLITPIRL